MLRQFLALALTLPAALWVLAHERSILRRGTPLDQRLLAAAKQAGVRRPERVRIATVDLVPPGVPRRLQPFLQRWGVVESAGMCLRYGIYIDRRWAQEPQVIIHELVHTAQYERLGLARFIGRYLHECFTLGYARSPLEQQARELTARIDP
jgi:hypothetical protein